MNEERLNLFERMSVNPNDVIYAIIFKTYAELGNERVTTLRKQLLDQVLHKAGPAINALGSTL